MKIASRATPEGLARHTWPAGHGLSTTALHEYKIFSCKVCQTTYWDTNNHVFVETWIGNRQA